MVAYSFNSQQFQPQYSGGGGLPPGLKYKGVIVESGQEPTADQRGGMLVFEIQVIEGPLQGQKMTERLNLHNISAKAVEIANKQLSAYCHVTGQYTFQDTAELHNKPFLFDVAPQTKNPQYTEITALYDLNGNAPGKAGAGPTMAQNQPPANMPPPGGVAPQGGQGGWQGAPPPSQPGNGGNGWGGSTGGQPGNGPPPPNGGQGGPQGGWGGGQPPAGQGGWGGGGGAPQQGPAPGAWQPGGQPQGGGNASWGNR